MQQKEEYKYFAFISYNSKDARWGRRLQRKLEGYRMPATLCSEHGWKRRPITPVFYAPTDIQPGDLRQELEARLRASRHLIVICSPHSANAKWVGWEIAYFHSLGRTENIHFFIVDGEPHSQDPERECFNPIIEELGIPEQLGANIHERVSRWPWVNRERANVQLITKLLGVEFDSLWQRHKRLLRRRCVLGVIAVVAVIAAIIGVWRANQPVDVCVRLQEISTHNNHLPPLKKAVVSITLDKETKRDTLDDINDIARFANIPHSAVGQPVRITMVCGNWLTLDTTMTLMEELLLSIKRDPIPYGNVILTLWDTEEGAGKAGVEVTIAGANAVSDADGRVRLTIPLEQQDTIYVIHSSVLLRDSLLKMPVSESSVMVVK
jgi:hypothetical protein